MKVELQPAAERELEGRQTDGDMRDTIAKLGRQISRRWFIGCERGVAAIRGRFQVVHRIALCLTIRARSVEVHLLDLMWVWRFQGPPRDAGHAKIAALPRRSSMDRTGAS